MASFCWQCGKPLKNAVGRPVKGVEREIATDQKVRLHKCCAETFDRDTEDVRITCRLREVHR